ncbi:vegetative cell wall protein gp1-like [Hyalella azteca]|uniref:Vegetative cell wall protein gp1-like n=1 Tax=Hyalella azteca TaxID=294128 RepID=A0A8B7P1G2_HYAAZ|nr:vegetative cell wall protein gp1-like [Hyalella azteca]
MTSFINRITNATNGWRTEDSSSTNEFNLPAARLANGARSPPTLHVNGIHRQTPDTQDKDELDSPVQITSGKFSPPPYLFDGLKNPFTDPWHSDTSKEDATSMNSLGLKELSKASTLERHTDLKNDISLAEDDLEDEEMWPLPPPPPVPSTDHLKHKINSCVKPPVPPKPPATSPYAIPNAIPSTSTLNRKTHRSQYAQPAVQSSASQDCGSSFSSVTSPLYPFSPTSTLAKNQKSLLPKGSMLSEIEKSFKELNDKISPEPTLIPPAHTAPPPPTAAPPFPLSNGSAKSTAPENKSSPPDPPSPPLPPPLPPASLPISPLSSSPTTPPDSPPSSPALSPPTSSTSSDSQPSSSPNSPPHFLMSWR